MPKTTDIRDEELPEPCAPPRPTAEEDRADHIADDFERASVHPYEAMYHLSGACDALLRLGREAKGRFQIGDAHRARLTMSICSARMTALSVSAERFHGSMKEGFDGALMIAAWLGADDERRASWPADTYPDARDHLTILRNGAHSRSLHQDIANRARAREDVIILDLLASAKAAA